MADRGSRRNSILKPEKKRDPFSEVDLQGEEKDDNDFDRRRSRRVSFANANYIKEFAVDPEKVTIWDSTYEEVVNSTESTGSGCTNLQITNNTHTTTRSIHFNETNLQMSEMEFTKPLNNVLNTTNFNNDDMEITEAICVQSTNTKTKKNITIYCEDDMEMTEAICVESIMKTKKSVKIYDEEVTTGSSKQIMQNKKANVTIYDDGMDLTESLDVNSLNKNKVPENMELTQGLNMNKTKNVTVYDDNMDITQIMDTEQSNAVNAYRKGNNDAMEMTCLTDSPVCSEVPNHTIYTDENMEMTVGFAIPKQKGPSNNISIFVDEGMDITQCANEQKIVKNITTHNHDNMEITRGFNMTNNADKRQNVTIFNEDDNMELTETIPIPKENVPQQNVTVYNEDMNITRGASVCNNEKNKNVTIYGDQYMDITNVSMNFEDITKKNTLQNKEINRTVHVIDDVVVQDGCTPRKPLELAHTMQNMEFTVLDESNKSLFPSQNYNDVICCDSTLQSSKVDNEVHTVSTPLRKRPSIPVKSQNYVPTEDEMEPTRFMRSKKSINVKPQRCTPVKSVKIAESQKPTPNKQTPKKSSNYAAEKVENLQEPKRVMSSRKSINVKPERLNVSNSFNDKSVKIGQVINKSTPNKKPLMTSSDIPRTPIRTTINVNTSTHNDNELLQNIPVTAKAKALQNTIVTDDKALSDKTSNVVNIDERLTGATKKKLRSKKEDKKTAEVKHSNLNNDKKTTLATKNKKEELCAPIELTVTDVERHTKNITVPKTPHMTKKVSSLAKGKLDELAQHINANLSINPNSKVFPSTKNTIDKSVDHSVVKSQNATATSFDMTCGNNFLKRFQAGEPEINSSIDDTHVLLSSSIFPKKDATDLFSNISELEHEKSFKPSKRTKLGKENMPIVSAYLSDTSEMSFADIPENDASVADGSSLQIIDNEEAVANHPKKHNRIPSDAVRMLENEENFTSTVQLILNPANPFKDICKYYSEFKSEVMDTFKKNIHEAFDNTKTKQLTEQCLAESEYNEEVLKKIEEKLLDELRELSQSIIDDEREEKEIELLNLLEREEVSEEHDTLVEKMVTDETAPIPTLEEKIMEMSKYSQNTWSVVSIDAFVFETFYHTIRFYITIADNSENVLSFRLVNRIEEFKKRDPIVTYLQTILLKNFQPEPIKSALGTPYTIFSLLDYMHMCTENTIKQFIVLKELIAKNMLTIEDNQHATFKILGKKRPYILKATANLSNIDNPSASDVAIDFCNGKVVQEDVKNALLNCPKGFDFLPFVIKKLQIILDV